MQDFAMITNSFWGHIGSITILNLIPRAGVIQGGPKKTAHYIPVHIFAKY